MASEPLRSALPNVFSGLSLDRASDRRDDVDWLTRAWVDARVICVDFEGRAAFEAADRIRWFRSAELDPAIKAQATFLGTTAAVEPPVAAKSGHRWPPGAESGVAAMSSETTAGGALFALPAGHLPGELIDRLDWRGLRPTAALLSPDQAGLFAYAKALLLWQTRARYCGACGSETIRTRAGHGARCRRDTCGLEHFPRTDAAVIMLVEHEGNCLLGRQPGWPQRRYSTLAGFVEPGESLEDALRREVLEEAGVQVGACHYQSSQPWPFPASLMLGYRAEACSRQITLGEELEDARWFSAEALVEAVRSGEVLLPFKVSISRRLIEDWLVDTLARPLDALLPGQVD